jgi:hypothetical protein
MIAIIEDPFIRKLLQDILAKQGMEVAALSPARALDMLRSGSHEISVLITNQPADFLPVAENVSLLYIEASPDPELAARFPRHETLSKPLMAPELVRAVKHLMSLECAHAG